MWTNRIDVLYQGGDQESQIAVVPGAPDIEGEATLVSPARTVAPRSLVRKSFQFLKTLAGM